MVDFLKEAEGIEQEVIGWRRHVHQYPELLMDLPETAAFVERELKNMGYEPEYICQSGIVAVLDSQKPGKTLLLRADMDALPIGEESGLEYASKHPGISHACGHDTHIAMLLGAAKLLMKHKDLLRAKSSLCFSPGRRAEEAHAHGGSRGAAFAGCGCMHGLPPGGGKGSCAYGNYRIYPRTHDGLRRYVPDHGPGQKRPWGQS